GIVGICCGLALVEAGMRVLLIDKNDPGQGASYGNAGVISPWSIVPQSVPGLWQKIPKWLLKSDGPIAIKPSYLFELAPWAIRFLLQGRIERVHQISDAMAVLNDNNIGRYRQLLKGSGEEDLIRDSFYVHAFRQPKQANLDSLEYSIRRNKNADLELIDQQELQALEPALSDQFKAAILIKGQARALSPGKLGQVLAKKFLCNGGVFLRSKVKQLQSRQDGRWNLVTDDKTIESGQIIVSAGAWSRDLLKPLDIEVPLEAERGYHLSFSNPGIELTHSVMDMDLKIVASSMQEGLRAAGTAEFAGLDTPANSKRLKSLQKCVKSMLPSLNTASASDWMGARPSTPDSLPCIGEVPAHASLFTAFGHGHYGLMMAPRTGEIIADLVTGKPANIDLEPYNLARFS
ncbi:MAG: FAD-dependent oxidoreductase, partial [Gammaproteobacteria bacterium]|nr:FAD-dependent oxidoreductase [Gammaproteobacteria bacterium]